MRRAWRKCSVREDWSRRRRRRLRPQPGRKARWIREDKFVPARVLWMRRWSPRLLSFRIEQEAGFRFVPGQFARLGRVNADGVPVWRAYSMASATWDDYLEFYSIVVPGGPSRRSWSI